MLLVEFTAYQYRLSWLKLQPKAMLLCGRPVIIQNKPNWTRKNIFSRQGVPNAKPEKLLYVLASKIALKLGFPQIFGNNYFCDFFDSKVKSQQLTGREYSTVALQSLYSFFSVILVRILMPLIIALKWSAKNQGHQEK